MTTLIVDQDCSVISITYHMLRTTYSRFKPFLRRNWYLLAWAGLYVLIAWYVDRYQISNIVAGFK